MYKVLAILGGMDLKIAHPKRWKTHFQLQSAKYPHHNFKLPNSFQFYSLPGIADPNSAASWSGHLAQTPRSLKTSQVVQKIFNNLNLTGIIPKSSEII